MVVCGSAPGHAAGLCVQLQSKQARERERETCSMCNMVILHLVGVRAYCCVVVCPADGSADCIQDREVILSVRCGFLWCLLQARLATVRKASPLMTFACGTPGCCLF